MKSPMLFLENVLADAGTWCGISTIRDCKTISDRIAHEGDSFLTITLPKFGKDLQKALDRGFVDSTLFTGFRFRGGLPVFLRGFLSHVFDPSDGRLFDIPCITCIHTIRQLTLMFGKIELECKPERVARAIKGYVDNETETREADARLSESNKAHFRRVSSLLFGSMFDRMESSLHANEFFAAKHGPGTTADALFGNAKWEQIEWTERLERVFPAGEYLLPNWRYNEYLSDVLFLSPAQERPTRLALVPKTLETPRIIAIEPTCMQFVQQALLGRFVEEIESSNELSALIGWSSSLPNQQLARQGSVSGGLATLDLKEASDRVSNQHVRALLWAWPLLSEGVDACRSRKVDVPGYGVMRLAKFASMGSALTFPMESMIFLTCIFMGIEKSNNRRLTKKDIKSYLGKVRVYGDDIIVPVDYVPAVISVLNDFGHRVNESKSYWTGKFRESCGKDYYDGHDISIVRVRRVFPTDRRQVSEIVSTVELRNHLYRAGYWRSAAYLDELLERLIPMPRVLETSPGLGRFSYLGFETQIEDPRLHRPLVKAAVVSSRSPVSRLDGVRALTKVLTIRGDLPIPDVEHLERAGRPRSSTLKTRFVTPY